MTWLNFTIWVHREVPEILIGPLSNLYLYYPLNVTNLHKIMFKLIQQFLSSSTLPPNPQGKLQNKIQHISDIVTYQCYYSLIPLGAVFLHKLQLFPLPTAPKGIRPSIYNMLCNCPTARPTPKPKATMNGHFSRGGGGGTQGIFGQWGATGKSKCTPIPIPKKI